MAINATIQVRRGLKADFDPTKMLPGEWAVSIDASTSNQIVWMCFAPGVCKRMGTYEDFKSMISQANGEIIEELRGEFEAILSDVESVAKDVSADKEEILVVKSEILDNYIPQIQNYVNTASTHAKNAKSSETNAKTSENNAKVSETNAEEFAEEAKSYAEQALSTTPDGYNQMVSDVDLLKNAIIQTTDRTLYGSKAGGIKLIGITGASEQGENPSPDNPQEIESVGDLKNLLDLSGLIESVSNGITFTPIFKSGLLQYILVNGTATAQARYYFPSNLVFEFDTILSLQGATNGGVSGYASGGNVFAEEKTMSAGTSYATFFLFVNSGVTAENVKIYPMIRKASVQNAEYKPYGYSLVIKAEGKNLARVNNFSVTAQGTALDYTPINMPIGTYAIGLVTSATSGSADILFYNADKVEIAKKNINLADFNARKTILFTVSSDISYMRVWTNTACEFTELQIEPNIATPYEPYRSKSITIPLNEPLRGIGDVKDEIICQDGVWGVLRRIGGYTFDGSDDESWVMANTGDTSLYRIQYLSTYGIFKGSSSTTVASNILCDSYIANPAGNAGTYGGKEGISVAPSGYMFIYDENYNTVDSLSDWMTNLAENPIRVLCELATPTFEPFTDQTPFYGLESFDTVTYISTDSEVEPSIELKFGKTEGDAVTLLNYNQTNLNRIAIAELTSAVLALNQE